MEGTAEHPELSAVRARIDEIDAALVALVADRTELAAAALAQKEKVGLPAMDPAREAQIVRMAAERARHLELEPELMRSIFWRILGLSHWAQNRPVAGEDRS